MTKATVLIEENHNLIYSYLHKMRLDIEEYYDLAAIGLCKAANNFDETKGFKFSTYAYRCMNNEVLNQIRKESRCVTPLLIFDMDEEDEEEKASLHLYTASKVSVENTVIVKMQLQDTLKTLTPPRRKFAKEVLSLALSGMTQRDIAERLHVSQASISRMLAFIKEKVYE